jgi:hypothetical protein
MTKRMVLSNNLNGNYEQNLSEKSQNTIKTHFTHLSNSVDVLQTAR